MAAAIGDRIRSAFGLRTMAALAVACVASGAAQAMSPVPCLSPGGDPQSWVPDAAMPEACTPRTGVMPSCDIDSVPDALREYTWHGDYSCRIVSPFKEPAKPVVVRLVAHSDDSPWFAIPRSQLPPGNYPAYGATPFLAAFVVGGRYVYDASGQPAATDEPIEKATFEFTVHQQSLAAGGYLSLFANGAEPEGFVRTDEVVDGLTVYRRADAGACGERYVVRDTPWGEVAGGCEATRTFVTDGREEILRLYAFHWQLEQAVVLQVRFYAADPSGWRKIVAAASEMGRIWRTDAASLPPKPDHEGVAP